MGTIRVEYVPIKKYYLGLLGLDHLQIVYEDETSFVNKQDNWYVLEGTHDGGLLDGFLGVLGEEITTGLSAANGATDFELVELIGTPASRGSRIVYQGPDALNLWHKMMERGQEIQANEFPYEGFALPFSPGAIINSSSVVATLLNVIGVDVNLNMPIGIRLSPGTSTILGTTGDDEIFIRGTSTQAVGGFGEDLLRGGATLLWPEKFYGGDDNDTIKWSEGENIIHGGQPRLAYALDGLDTVDYAGAGVVEIVATFHSVEHKTPSMLAAFDGGSDQLFSIEAVNWFRESDIITLGPGVELLEAPVKLHLDDSSGGRGDELGFQNSLTPLLVNVIDGNMISIQTVANQGLDAGFWAESAEWLTGSAANDLIYAGATLKGVDAGAGDDLIDASLAASFTRDSPNGYDIEIFGGEGKDTLVSGSGYSIASGGAGKDRFVLSAMTSSEDNRTEFVIADADLSDELYLPYDFFKEDRGDFDGSQLMQIRGAPFAITDTSPVSQFFWGPPSNDQQHGNIDFVGRIYFTMEGDDLLITVMQGFVEEEQVDNGPGEPPGPLIRRVVGDGATQTSIRVLDWQDGDLGITFPIVFDNEEFANNPTDEFYPGFNSALNQLVNPGILISPLDKRPDPYLPQDLKTETAALSARVVALAAPPATPTENDDIISMPDGGPYKIYALGGNDDVTGSAGGDVIDGGAGDDTMAGGRGNDAYFVDSAGDRVVEESRGGFDHVYSSVDYALPFEVEHLTLTGSAISGTGNGFRNMIAGNDADNILDGGEGDDTLAGNRGNDTLSGGGGADGYVYELGDGNDVIIELPGSGDGDVLVFAGQITAEDFTFTRNPIALDDLVIRFIDGGSLTIAGYYSSGGGTIEGIEFVAGPVWTLEEFQAHADTAIVTDNRTPIAADDAFVYAGPNTFRLPVAALLENDRDPDGDALTVTGILNASQGTAVLDGAEIIVTASSGETPSAVFTYIVADAEGATSTAIAEISFWPNSAPTVSSTSLAPVRSGSSAQGQIVADDADDDTLFYAIKPEAGPQHGSITFLEGGQFTYTPTAGVSGTDGFTLLVSDPFGASTEAVFNFDILNSNAVPEANDDSGFHLRAGTALTISSLTLLANDTDADHDALSITSVADARGGSVSFDTSHNVVFTEDRTFSGQAQFTYTVSDGHGGADTATVLLTVDPVDAGSGKVLVGTNRRDALYGTDYGDYFIGKKGADYLAGGAGNDVFLVSGDHGHDRISGGTGYDVLRGSARNDVFHVSSGLRNLKSVEEIDGGRGRDKIVATAGSDVINLSLIKIKSVEAVHLGAGNDWVRGTAANETFFGGAGNDTFRISKNSGHDVIADFSTAFNGHRHGSDRLDLRDWHFADWEAVLKSAHQSGRDLVIELDARSSVTLKHTNALTITHWDVIL